MGIKGLVGRKIGQLGEGEGSGLGSRPSPELGRDLRLARRIGAETDITKRKSWVRACAQGTRTAPRSSVGGRSPRDRRPRGISPRREEGDTDRPRGESNQTPKAGYPPCKIKIRWYRGTRAIANAARGGLVWLEGRDPAQGHSNPFRSYPCLRASRQEWSRSAQRRS